MKRLLSFIVVLCIGTWVFAQGKPLEATMFTLDNGLQVVLVEEHSTPNITGAVLVHAGSKNENPNATGVAHYFEHIMFKGTDRIGTTDWKAEKVYLDSISAQYDSLHATQDVEKRKAIQREINRLNITASQYAIPNEVDAILQQMGCTGLNAGTSYDYTIYYNELPANQLENWMDVYVERFRNPVFRLFQSELETIYEEKNMYENQQMYAFSRNIFTIPFGEHPYSRDVIGYGEHLKNPQPSEMQKFFDTYYVANNMALVLVGDFSTAEARKMIEKKFGTWRSGKLPERPTYKLNTFDKREVIEVKQTPISAGVILFPGVKATHEDALVLDMIDRLLNDDGGLFDKAVSDGRLMTAQGMALSLEDAGANAILYVPKLLGQKHEAAEEIVWRCLDTICKGQFSKELMESIKTSAYVERERQKESRGGIFSVILEQTLQGRTLQDWQNDNERWQSMTVEDVMRVANKYFSRDHCSILRSKMGFPKHDEAVKPDWDHLEAVNKDAKSKFAEDIYSRKTPEGTSQVVKIGEDVMIDKLNDHYTIYSTKNPKNDLFSLTIYYNYGRADDKDIERAVDYFNRLGAGDMTSQEFDIQMNMLGGSFYLNSDYTSTTINISGLECNMDKIVELCKLKLEKPRHDAQQLKNIAEEEEASRKAAKKDADIWNTALYEYVIYGDQSDYLYRTPLKQWKTRTGEEIFKEIQNIFTRNGHVEFIGNVDCRDIVKQFVRDDVEDMKDRVRQRVDYNESQVFYCTNKKFIQSNIDFLMPGIKFDKKDIPQQQLFNEYFGGSMNSIVFQEIREFRSLGYSTYAYFNYDALNRTNSYAYAFLGTQCDKTLDGIEAMSEILQKLPEREDKFETSKAHKITAHINNYVTFRSLPAVAYGWELQGYKEDPRPEITEKIRGLQLDDVIQFHQKYIQGKPLLIFITGNEKKFDKKALSKYGKVTKIAEKDLFVW